MSKKILNVAIVSAIVAVEVNKNEVIYAGKVLEYLTGEKDKLISTRDEKKQASTDLIGQVLSGSLTPQEELKALKDGKAINGRVAKLDDSIKIVSNDIDNLTPVYEKARKEAEDEIIKLELAEKEKTVLSALGKINDKITSVKQSLIVPLALLLGGKIDDSEISIFTVNKKRVSKGGKRNSTERRENINGTAKFNGTAVKVKLCKLSGKWVALSDYADKTSSCKEAVRLDRARQAELAELKTKLEAEKVTFSKNFFTNAKAETDKLPQSERARALSEAFQSMPEKMAEFSAKIAKQLEEAKATPLKLIDTKSYPADTITIQEK